MLFYTDRWKLTRVLYPNPYPIVVLTIHSCLVYRGIPSLMRLVFVPIVVTRYTMVYSCCYVLGVAVALVLASLEHGRRMSELFDLPTT